MRISHRYAYVLTWVRSPCGGRCEHLPDSRSRRQRGKMGMDRQKKEKRGKFLDIPQISPSREHGRRAFYEQAVLRTSMEILCLIQVFVLVRLRAK